MPKNKYIFLLFLLLMAKSQRSLLYLFFIFVLFVYLGVFLATFFFLDFFLPPAESEDFFKQVTPKSDREGGGGGVT